jgi:hypothetical protein
LSQELEFDRLAFRTVLQRMLVLTIVLFVAFQLAACGIAAPAPTVTAIATAVPSLLPPTPSITPLPVNMITGVATVILFPTCTPLSTGYILVIDEEVYHSDAGIELGARGAIGVLQEALDEYHPEWAQEDELAEYVWDSSHTQNIGVNPRVLLVTAGVSLDWQVIEGNNLLEDISRAGVALTQHYREFRFNEELQANYPQVANAESYALFVFFDYDLEKLNAWQQEYDQMFGDIQPRIITEGC